MSALFRKLFALIGIGFGGLFLLAPDQALELYKVPPDQRTPAAKAIMRYFGSRTLMLGLVGMRDEPGRAVASLAAVGLAADMTACGLSATQDGAEQRSMLLAAGTSVLAGLVGMAGADRS